MASVTAPGDQPYEGVSQDGERAGNEVSEQSLNNNQQTQDASFPSVTSSDVPGDVDDDDGDDSGEYDPEALPPSPPQVRSPVRPTRPKTTGGFIVGSSDDEDDEGDEDDSVPAPKDVTPAQQAASVAPVATATLSPFNNDRAASRDVSATAVTNGPSPSEAINIPLNTAPGHGSAPSQDMVSILEARVNSDPRGDMDGWLALIAEYRRRNNLEEVRAIYDRFLKIFPQAVSAFLYLSFSP